MLPIWQRGTVIKQQRRTLRKAISLTAAAMVGVSVVRDADSPHVEQREYAEEPCMTFDSPYTTASAVILNFPLFGSGLESIPTRQLKKQTPLPRNLAHSGTFFGGQCATLCLSLLRSETRNLQYSCGFLQVFS
jgi:hypothetical protein